MGQENNEGTTDETVSSRNPDPQLQHLGDGASHRQSARCQAICRKPAEPRQDSGSAGGGSEDRSGSVLRSGRCPTRASRPLTSVVVGTILLPETKTPRSLAEPEAMIQAVGPPRCGHHSTSLPLSKPSSLDKLPVHRPGSADKRLGGLCLLCHRSAYAKRWSTNNITKTVNNAHQKK